MYILIYIYIYILYYYMFVYDIYIYIHTYVYSLPLPGPRLSGCRVSDLYVTACATPDLRTKIIPTKIC